MLLTEIQRHSQILGMGIAILWVIEGVDQFIFKSALDQFGIRPRRWKGIRGIILAPLLHGSFKHLVANTMPFLVLGWFVLLDGERTFAIVTGTAWLGGGIAVWLLGRSHSNHIGASGLVFGYLGYVLARGYLIQSFGAIALAVIACLLYGSLIWGILPLRRRSSWEGHLFGFLAGIASANYLQVIAVILLKYLGF